MIAEGQPAPDIELPDQDGQTVRLSDLKGAPVVLYFYPKDDTPGCTKQACGFQENLTKLKRIKARVVGVSPDTSASHRKFADKYKLNFTLLADTQKAACQAYGVWKEKNMYGKKSMGVERTTLIIDGDGVIRKIYPKVKVDGHIEDVVEALTQL